MVLPWLHNHLPVFHSDVFFPETFNVDAKPAFEHLDVFFLIRVEVARWFSSREGNQVRVREVERDLESKGEGTGALISR